MSAPHRIQRKRTRGWKMPANTVYVGRPTIWGNPFRVSNGDCDHPDCGPKSHPPLTAQQVVEAYRRYLPGLLKVQPANLIERLRGKDLCLLVRRGPALPRRCTARDCERRASRGAF